MSLKTCLTLLYNESLGESIIYKIECLKKCTASFCYHIMIQNSQHDLRDLLFAYNIRLRNQHIWTLNSRVQRLLALPCPMIGLASMCFWEIPHVFDLWLGWYFFLSCFFLHYEVIVCFI